MRDGLVTANLRSLPKLVFGWLSSLISAMRLVELSRPSKKNFVLTPGVRNFLAEHRLLAPEAQFLNQMSQRPVVRKRPLARS